MFTIDQLRAAHSKVKTGADFPQYVQDIIKLGVVQYSTYVADGHTEYTGTDVPGVKTESKYSAIVVADNSHTEQFKKRLKLHQQGGTDYFTFCKDAAETGVEKWTVDTIAMTCTYYDKTGNKIVVEQIPVV